MIIEDTLTRILQNTVQILEDLESIERDCEDHEYTDILKVQPELEALQEAVSSYL